MVLPPPETSPRNADRFTQLSATGNLRLSAFIGGSIPVTLFQGVTIGNQKSKLSSSA